MPGITYTIAVRDKAGAVTGVFTIDFHLSRLVELARELQFSMNGRVVITTADHIALAHPLRPVVRKAAAGPELVPVKDLGDPAMSAFIARGAGVTSFEIAGEPYLVRTQPIEATGWNVTVYAPESDFTAMMRGRAFMSLLISEETFEQAREHVIARPIDVVAVKGKKQGVRVFELLALTSDNDATAQAVADASSRALAAYLERRFTDAAAAWDEVLAKRTGDRAAGIMRDRALVYASTPPPSDWSGVMVATEK